MFLTNPRVQAALRGLTAVALLAYGLWLAFHSNATTFDRILGALIAMIQVFVILTTLFVNRPDDASAE